MTQELLQLLTQAKTMRDSPQRLAVLQEAERVAEADGESTRMLFDIRMAICNAGTFSGQHHIALVAFTWCYQQFDRDKDTFGEDEHDMIWKYKWILEHLQSFPDISLEQIEAAREDFRRRCKEAGYGERAYYALRYKSEMRHGYMKDARKHRDLWAAIPKDAMSDCLACETESDAEFSSHFGEWEECLQKSAPVLSGRQRCSHVPHRVLGMLAVAFAKTGDTYHARKCVDKGIQMTAGNPEFLHATADEIEALTILNDRPAAVRLFETWIRWAAESHEIRRKLCFFLSSIRLLTTAIQADGNFRMKLEEDLLAKMGVTNGDAENVLHWLEAESAKIAAAFDRRNRNSHWTDRLNRVRGGEPTKPI